MKKPVALIAIGATLLGCSLFTRENAKTVLDVAKVACIIANAESTDETVTSICDVADKLIPDMQRLLGEQRKAARRYAAQRMAAARCVDGGAP